VIRPRLVTITTSKYTKKHVRASEVVCAFFVPAQGGVTLVHTRKYKNKGLTRDYIIAPELRHPWLPLVGRFRLIYSSYKNDENQVI